MGDNMVEKHEQQQIAATHWPAVRELTKIKMGKIKTKKKFYTFVHFPVPWMIIITIRFHRKWFHIYESMRCEWK